VPSFAPVVRTGWLAKHFPHLKQKLRAVRRIPKDITMAKYTHIVLSNPVEGKEEE